MTAEDAQSKLGPHAGRCGPLDSPAAGCVPASSEDGNAVKPQPGLTGAGCAVAAEAAGTSPEPIKPTTVREFEHALRTLGFTKRESESIARHGFRAAANAADGDTADMESIFAAVQRNIRNLQT